MSDGKYKTETIKMRNRNGIEIKECCASCKHRCLDNDGRSCSLTKVPVASGYRCEKWTMHKRLQNAGNSGGKVKSWHYLHFFMERWTQQREAYEAGRIEVTGLLSAEDIRKEYREQHGSEFIHI